MLKLLGGIALAVAGTYIALQARLPKERRIVRAPNGGSVLGARQCVRAGGIIFSGGPFMALEGAGVIHITSIHILLAVVLSAIAIVAAEFVADS